MSKHQKHNHHEHEHRESDPSAATNAEPEIATESVSADPAIEDLRSKLAEREKEVAELKDKYLRTLAESENARKRIRQQSEESARLQKENVLRDLLSVIDNLERALDAARGGGNGKSIVEGIEMVLASFNDFLKQQGVTAQNAIGQPFDPARHEAVDQVHSDSHAPNTVAQEYHRGYLIGDRVLRPARVVVTKGPDAGQIKNET